MEKTEIKKQQIANQIADHVLLHGMKATSLRSLAAAIGTSDRMLLHYFVNKEALMVATLTIVATRLIQLLDHTSTAQMPFEKLLPHLVDMMHHPMIRPYLRVWLDLAALSATETFYHPITSQICAIFVDWIASALHVEHEDERPPMAAFALTMLEGFVVLDAFDQAALITQALHGMRMRCVPST